MRLADFLNAYVVARDVSPHYVYQLRLTVRRFSDWLGRPAELSDLTDDPVNRFLSSLLDEGRSRATVKGQRGNLLALWRAAYGDELISLPPRRVRKVGVPATLPEAWTMMQLERLLATADGLDGVFLRSRVDRPKFWRAFVLTGWDSGLRLGDLRRLRRDQIGADGSVVLSQHKTRWPIICKLRPETVAAIDATYPPARDLIFGRVLGRRQMFEHFRRLVQKAGLTGGTKKIRKSSATWLEAYFPGNAAGHLGHKTPGLAVRHYLDPRHLGHNRPLPPKIG